MPEGFFGMEYTGAIGNGIGLLALKGGKIAGVDASGGIYSGEYNVASNVFNGVVHLDVPAGHTLVTGYTNPSEFRLSIPLRLPPDLGGGRPMRIDTSTGPVTVLLKKISEMPL